MRTLIIGCGPAGYYTATKLKAALPEETITILDGEGAGFYTKIRLPEYLAGTLAREKLIFARADDLARKGITLESGVQALSLDCENKVASTSAGDRPFDRLILATGGRPFVPPVEGDATKEIHTLRTLADADAIMARSQANADEKNAGKRALVMGGGLLGLEAAHSLIKAGWSVCVVEYFPQLLPRQLSSEAGAKVQAILEGLGFDFKLGRTVKRVEHPKEGARELAISLDNGEQLEADMVLASAGVRSETSLAAAAGLAVDKGILVDERFETSVKGIYALGDCTQLPGGSIPGLWMAAMSQAEALAGILAGSIQGYESPVFKPVVKIPGVNMQDL